MGVLGEGNKALQYEALRQFIKNAGLKYIEFADLAGINRSSFQTILSKQSSLKSDTFMKILNAMNSITSKQEEGSDISKELSALCLIFMFPVENLAEIIKNSRDADVMPPEDIEFIQQLTGATLVDGKLIYPDGTRNFPFSNVRGSQKRLILSRKNTPFQSDKAVRLVCNMDTELHNLVSKSAEKNHRTFEDELENIIYWNFEDQGNQ